MVLTWHPNNNNNNNIDDNEAKMNEGGIRYKRQNALLVQDMGLLRILYAHGSHKYALQIQTWLNAFITF